MLIRDYLIRLLGGVSPLRVPVIEFIVESPDFDVIPHPQPASRFVPEWFKSLPKQIDQMVDAFGAPMLTAKMCKPMLDAMTLGYVMPLFGDTNIRTNEDCSLIEIGGNRYGSIIEHHDAEQIGGITPGPAIKFVNRIVVKTAPGFSTLFIPLPNSMETRFTCLSAVVDTDTYMQNINFPAIWHEPNYDALLKHGMPLILAIPFERAKVPKDVIVRVMTSAEVAERERVQRCQSSRRHVYTKELRCPR